MAGGLSLNFRARCLNWAFQKTPATQPSTDYAVSLHTGDPGDAGGAATEPTIGTGSYARAVLTAANITAADPTTGSAGDIKEITNTASFSFAASSAAWSTGATALAWFAIWHGASRATTTALADLVATGQLTQTQAVNGAGITLSFAAGALDITMDNT